MSIAPVVIAAALQRSAMFPAMVRETSFRFAPLERGRIFVWPRIYKHFAPTGAMQFGFVHIEVNTAKK